MNKKNMAILIITFLMSGFVWWLGIYNRWIQELILFEMGSFISMFTGSQPQIPEDENVTVVKYGEFAYRRLNTIIIPDNINTIEASAFKGNRLTSITLGKNVSLGENSFGSYFESVYNRNSREAGTFTRSNHKSTEWVIWYDSFGFTNNDNITITAFSGSGAVIIPDMIHGVQVVRIGEKAFRNKNITAITIPNSVKNIGVNTFAENRITRVSIGANVTLGDGSDNQGVLGRNTGFNTAYSNNGKKSGVYTRPNVNTTAWSRTAR